MAIVYDERKVDDVILALLHLNAFQDKFGWRAWKGFDWEPWIASTSVG